MSDPLYGHFHLNNAATAARQEYLEQAQHMPGNMTEIRPLAELRSMYGYMARTTATGSASISGNQRSPGLPPPEYPDSDTPRPDHHAIHMLQVCFGLFQRLEPPLIDIVRCGKSRFS